MEIGNILDVKDSREWRAWLAKHHKHDSEVWLVFYKKVLVNPASHTTTP